MENLFLFETRKCLWEILPLGSETCTCINAQSIVHIYIIAIPREKRAKKQICIYKGAEIKLSMLEDFTNSDS